MFIKVLESEFFKEKDDSEELSMSALLLWGCLLCAGDRTTKARVFYDILQDTLQPQISAYDKDFVSNFDTLITLATKMVYTYEKELGNMSPVMTR